MRIRISRNFLIFLILFLVLAKISFSLPPPPSLPTLPSDNVDDGEEAALNVAEGPLNVGEEAGTSKTLLAATIIVALIFIIVLVYYLLKLKKNNIVKPKKRLVKKKYKNLTLTIFIIIIGVFFALIGFNMVGRVVSELPAWAAAAQNNLVLGSYDIALTAANNYQATNTITIQNEDVVYKTGYLLKNNQWAPFEFSEAPIAGTNWILGVASHTFTVNRNEFVEGENYVLTYACARAGLSWDCHGNKWIIEGFNIRVSAGICEPGTYSCDGNVLMICSEDGQWTVGKECEGLEVCDANAGACVMGLPSEPGEPGEAASENGCSDSDKTANYPDGINYYQQGTVDGYYPLDDVDTSKTDYCQSITEGGVKDWVLEYYCYPDQTRPYITASSYHCLNGCENGACKGEGAQNNCVDSDEGKDYYKAGSLTGTDSYGNIIDQTDQCSGMNLYEKYCTDTSYTYETFECPNGCENGACIEEAQGGCRDTDSGADPWVGGIVTDGSGEHKDYCNNQFGLYESRCIDNAASVCLVTGNINCLADSNGLGHITVPSQADGTCYTKCIEAGYISGTCGGGLSGEVHSEWNSLCRRAGDDSSECYCGNCYHP